MQQDSEFAKILKQKSENVFGQDTVQMEFSRQQNLLIEHLNGADPAHLTFLISQIQTLKLPANFKKSTYPKPTPKPRKPHALNSQQQQAFARFQAWGSSLSPGYSSKELKTEFRSLAKKLHPDISKNNGEDFILLKKHYESLILVLK